MEFMFAWYPALKFFVFGFIIDIVVILAYKKYYKASAVIVIMYLIFLVLAPVKIDGTASKAYHKITKAHQETKYKAIEADLPTINLQQKTFQERMAEENLRSSEANKKIQDEM